MFDPSNLVNYMYFYVETHISCFVHYHFYRENGENMDTYSKFKTCRKSQGVINGNFHILGPELQCFLKVKVGLKIRSKIL